MKGILFVPLTIPPLSLLAFEILTLEQQIDQLYETPRTIDEIKAVLRSEFPDILILDKQMEPYFAHAETQEDKGNIPLSRVVARVGNLKDEYQEVPETFVGKVSNLYFYITQYGNRKVCKKGEENKVGDCCTFSNDACKTLSQYGMPMYQIGVCPMDPKDENDRWHMHSAVKLGDNMYLIIDNMNTAAVFWRGTLNDFLGNYDEILLNQCKVKLLPKGVGPYKDYFFDIGRAIATVRNGTTEDSMEQMTLQSSNFDAGNFLVVK